MKNKANKNCNNMENGNYALTKISYQIGGLIVNMVNFLFNLKMDNCFNQFANYACILQANFIEKIEN